MASVYPGAIDDFSAQIPSAGSPRNNPSLAGNIANLIDAVHKIENELGVAPSGSYASVLLRIARTMQAYANAAARDAAIAAPAEGDTAYLQDINAITVYDGSAWRVRLVWGTGTPEGAVTATRGALFMRTDGGASTTLYVKESDTTNTGWVAAGAGGGGGYQSTFLLMGA